MTLLGNHVSSDYSRQLGLWLLAKISVFIVKILPRQFAIFFVWGVGKSGWEERNEMSKQIQKGKLGIKETGQNNL